MAYQLSDEPVWSLQTQTDCKFYSTLTAPPPMTLVPFLILGSYLLVTKDVLVVVYNDREKYIKGLSQHQRAGQRAIAVIRSTLQIENHHFFDTNQGIKKGYLHLSKQFEKDDRLERLTVRDRLGKFNFKYLYPYIDQFKRLLADYEFVCGHRTNEEIVTHFLRNIPDKNLSLYLKTIGRNTMHLRLITSKATVQGARSTTHNQKVHKKISTLTITTYAPFINMLRLMYVHVDLVRSV